MDEDNKKIKDHREIGQELDLFTTSPLVGGGLPLFTPKGTVIRKALQEFIDDLQKEYTYYHEVWIPHMAKPDLYKASGHLDKYPERFDVTSSEGDKFILKPMNCPHHMQIFASRPRSYKELPFGYKEFTTNYRDEQSGELNGLLRVRSLTMDDCHIFCTEETALEEAKKVYQTIMKFYSAFNFEVSARFSFRDPNNKEKYIGDDATWEKSENLIKTLAQEVGIKNAIEGIGEAAFYGPKLDFLIKDSLGRQWQLATIQFDLIIPKRLGVEYVDKYGKTQTPVVIHRAIAGSVERFIGILLEQYQGNLPTWLSPVQVMIVPISDKSNKYGQKLLEQLKDSGLRAEIDERSESMQAKIRDAQLQKIPYMIIIGEKEEQSGKISIRTRSGENVSDLEFEQFLDRLNKEIADRS